MERNVAVFDLGIDQFVGKLKAASAGAFAQEVALVLQAHGADFLRVVEDEIIRKQVVDTRLLLASFHQGHAQNVYTIADKGLTLEVGTNVEYAAYVNDGHWTCKEGQENRFVPGIWEGSRFVYETGATTGMVLTQKWIPGAHYWESALQIYEKIFEASMERKLQEWLDKTVEG